MDRQLDVLRGRLEQIAYPHIRARLQALANDPRALLDYINHLFLDTRDGTRRGFDLTTAGVLMDIKHDLMVHLGEVDPHGGHTIVSEQDFTVGTPGVRAADYGPVRPPKNW